MTNTYENILHLNPSTSSPPKKKTILEDLVIINKKKRIKLRARPVPANETPNKQSLFLDISKDGKRK